MRFIHPTTPSASRRRSADRRSNLRAVVSAGILVLAALLVAPVALADHDSGNDSYPTDGYGQDGYSDTGYSDAGYGDTGYSDTGYGDPYGDSASGDGYGAYDDGQPADYDSGYSYVRNLRGDATLIQADGERDPLGINQPVLVGDRLRVAPGSMAEILLSDGNLLRIDGDSEVSFDALAGSPEAQDGSTALRLLEGNLQLVVFENSLGDALPRIDLPNATFHVATAGRYRLTSDRGDWSQVVSRRGRGDLVTPRGVESVRAGSEVLVEGYRAPRLVARQASGYDSLERWGERLDRQVADEGYVDDRLRYAAAPLDDHGAWISVSGSRAWRPRVAVDWSPYTEGRWRHTPLGLTWVSHEPWGWVPYHYGTWDYVGHHGWVWFPGRSFSPARVHWYWGPTHVAWVPSGYYSRHYGRRHGFGVRHGVYGWAGGSWDPFSRWVFCSTRDFGRRYQGRYAHSGRYWGRHHRGVLPRGIVTTDTRRLTRDRWHDPDGALRALRTRPGRGAADTRGRGGRRGAVADLPDVTPFIARTDHDELPTEVRRRVLRVADGQPARGRGARTGGATDRGAGSRNGAVPRLRSGERPSGAARTDSGSPVLRRTPPSAATQRPGAQGPSVDRGPRATPRVTPRSTPSRDVGEVSPDAGRNQPRVRVRPPQAERSEDRRPDRGGDRAPTRRRVAPRGDGGADTANPGRQKRSGDGELSASPRFRTGGGLGVRTPRSDGTPSKPRAGATSAGGDRPRGSARTQNGGRTQNGARTQTGARPDTVQPRRPAPGARNGGTKPPATRRQRADSDADAPARRVLRGHRNGAPAPRAGASSPSPRRPPAASQRPAPSRRPSASQAPRTQRRPSASSSSRGDRRPSASARSGSSRRPAASAQPQRSRSGAKRSSAGSRSSGGGKSGGKSAAKKSSAQRSSKSSSGSRGKAARSRGQRRDDGG